MTNWARFTLERFTPLHQPQSNPLATQGTLASFAWRWPGSKKHRTKSLKNNWLRFKDLNCHRPVTTKLLRNTAFLAQVNSITKWEKKFIVCRCPPSLKNPASYGFIWEGFKNPSRGNFLLRGYPPLPRRASTDEKLAEISRQYVAEKWTQKS